MVKTTDDVPKISASSTKKEMLEAFNKLKAKFQELDKAALKPEISKQQKQAAEAVGAAEKITAESANERVARLKQDIGRALSDIAAQLEEESAKYDRVKQAIELKENELKELFEIERSAFALAALLEAQKEKAAAFEEEMARRKQALEEEIDKTKDAWDKEKKQYQDGLKEQRALEEKVRKREREEYEYSWNRERELKNNQLRDELQKLEREIQSQREAFEKQTASKEEELKGRELAVSEREQALDALQKRVDAFPAEKEAAVKQAVSEVTERLQLETKTREELLRKGFEGEKNVLASKIESLEQLAEAQKRQIDALSNQIEKAYAKVQDIAVKAVASAQPRAAATPVPSNKSQETI